MGLGHEKLDVLVVGKALENEESQSRKIELDRIAAMLSRLDGRGYRVKKDSVPFGSKEFDFDPDSDFDTDVIRSQQGGAPDGMRRR